MSRMKWVLVILAAPAIAWGQLVELNESGESIRAGRVSINKDMAVDGYDLREQRKVGVGIQAGGVSGLLGVNIELNFSPQVSFLSGFGLGSDFQTLNLQAKRVIPGTWFLPYIAGGVAYWYTRGSKDSIDSTTPSFLGKQMLSNSERRRGEFAETFLYPSLGVQYVQLSGDGVGNSFYAEVMILIDVDDLITVPTGGVGYTYYF